MTNIIGQIKSPKKYVDSIKKAKIKQKSFEKFLKRTFITFVLHVLIFLFNAIVPFIIIKQTGAGSIAITIGALILDLIFILILNRVMFRIIDYEMNFGICTKDKIISYKQDGFFKTKTMDISKDAIKIIQHSKEGIRSALFHYGNICIYTDSVVDDNGKNSIELSYIPDPKRLVKKLNLMMGKTEQEKTEG